MSIRVDVMSRREFEEYTKNNHRMSSIVVSISSRDENTPNITDNKGNNIVSILKLHFNDTDNSNPDKGGITAVQALLVSSFVKSSIHLVDKVIVHCGAGQSRSAGVAAAILKYYTGSDFEIFDNHKYTPNMLCYRLVLEALMVG